MFKIPKSLELNNRLKVRTLGFLFLVALLIAGTGIMGVSFYLKRDANVISETWQEFQQASSVKTRIITALWADFGYGGMIHNFKNYVLRHEENYYIEASSNFDGVKGLLAQYRVLRPAPQELEALTAIEGVVNRYEKALDITRNLISEGKSISEIDDVVKVDDMLAIEGMAILKRLYDDQVAVDLPVLQKYRNLAELRHALGYDGMIHHFKNYILRQDGIDAERTSNDLRNISGIIDDLKILELTETELQAVSEVENIVADYAQALQRARDLMAADYTVPEIDSAVQVNDIYAISALITLDRAISIHTEAEAVHMSNIINNFEDVIALVNSIIPFAGIIFICSMIWILKARVIDPIGKMALLTRRLADGDLSINIDEKLIANDEIGEMANALTLFRKNAIRQTEVESRLRKILEITPQAIITIDKNFNIHLFNKGAEKIFGYLESQLIGQSMEVLIPEQYREDHYGHIANYMNINKPTNLLMGQRGEISGLKKDGSEFPAIASIATIDNGGESMFLVALVDISKQKKIEHRLKSALDQKEKANRVKSEFMASMSHELRTPLNSILGFSEIMSNEIMGPLGNPQYIEYAKNINQSGRHLLDMVNDILDIERIETGNFNITISEIDIRELLVECHQLLIHRVFEKDIILKFDVGDEIKLFSVDRRAILQILINLLVNAMKFTDEGGSVKLEANYQDSFLVLKISDTGIGIPKEKIALLTDPFVRHETDPHKSQEGVGLGLAISNSLVKLHGGKMIIESEVGVGTAITVILPGPDGDQLNLI